MLKLRKLAAAALVAAAVCVLTAHVQAQTIRVEGESYVLPNGVATMGSGPNATGITTLDANPAASNGFIIGFFGAWDWLEYNVTAPADGLYNLSFKYTDGDTLINPLPVTLTFYTTGKQYQIGNVATTGGWAWTDFTTITAEDDAAVPLAIPLKAGANRFRVAIRPDAVFVGAMNVDYYEFTKTADPYPAYQTISGQVTTHITGAATPLAGAIVSVGPDYHTASNITRTDATGSYTLYVPAGSYSLTAFCNGFAPSTTAAPVAAPGTSNFDLSAGRYEAELLDATNPGPEPDKGVQPAYDTGAASGVPLSNNGEIVYMKPGRYAEYKSVYAPADLPSDGVCDLRIHYSSLANVGGAIGDPGYLTWAVNTTSTVKMTYGATSMTDFLTYADSAPMLLTLKKGMNTLRFTDANTGTGGNPNTPAANIDYFTIAASTQPHGKLTITVTDLSNKAVSSATITATSATSLFTGVTQSDGTYVIPVPAGTYSVTANKSGAAGPVTVSNIVVADGQTVSVPIQLNISGAAVEAEDFTSGGPAMPPATVTDLASASNGKVVTGFTGAYLQDWLEWTINVTTDGLYRLTLRYAIPPDGDINHPVYPVDLTVNVSPSTFHARTINIPRTTDGDTYGGYDLQDDLANAILLPLKAGNNTIRLSLAAGTMNLDYIQVTKLQAYPTNVRTITGTISGTDTVGTAPLSGATVWLNNNGLHTTLPEAQFATTTDALGHYSITAYTGGAFLGSQANGFVFPGTTPYVTVTAGTATKDVTMNVKPPTPPDTGTEQVDAFKLSKADPALQTNENKITFTGPGKFFELPINVARAGLYTVGMYYSSGWTIADGNPVRTTWTVNGAPQEVDFATTSLPDYSDYKFAPTIATIPLNAGGNTLRIDFIDKGANIVYLTLLRSGALPPSTTDINGSGKTDIVDAVTYARRLGGLDTGAKPDLTGDGLSNAADVVKILRVAGGLS
jgi:hypothetical protein